MQKDAWHKPYVQEVQKITMPAMPLDASINPSMYYQKDLYDVYRMIDWHSTMYKKIKMIMYQNVQKMLDVQKMYNEWQKITTDVHAHAEDR